MMSLLLASLEMAGILGAFPNAKLHNQGIVASLVVSVSLRVNNLLVLLLLWRVILQNKDCV